MSPTALPVIMRYKDYDYRQLIDSPQESDGMFRCD